MSKTVKIIAGCAVSGLCLWLVFRGFHPREIKEAMVGASYGWLVPCLALTILNLVLRSARWRILLSPLKEISLAAITPVLITGFFLNNVLPARGGELARAYGMQRTQGIPVSSALGSIVVERLTDLLGILVVMLIAARLLPWDRLPVSTLVAVLAAGIFAIVIFIAFAQKKKDSISTMEGMTGKLLRFVLEIPAGFLALRSFRKAVWVLTFSLSIWMLEVLNIVLFSRVMHFDMSFIQSAAFIVGLSFGVMVPAAPGYVGTYEFFGKEALVLLGFPAAPALAFVLVLHFYQMAVLALVGLPCLIKVGTVKK